MPKKWIFNFELKKLQIEFTSGGERGKRGVMSVTKMVLNPTPVHRLSQRLKNAPRNRVTIRSGVRESLKCSGKTGQKRCGTYCKGGAG